MSESTPVSPSTSCPSSPLPVSQSVVTHGFCQYIFDPTVKIGSSQLHPATRKTTNASSSVSIKHIPKAKCPEFLQLEGVVHNKLSKNPHAHLATLLEAFEDSTSGDGYVVQPQYDQDLHSYIRVNGRFHEDQAKILFRQLVSAVYHCHSLKIVLRDIKLGKILFTSAERTQIIIADLEGAQEVCPSEPLLFDQKGSPAYVSPEVLTCQPYDGAAADMWTLGVVLYVMVIGSYPFQDKRPANLFQKIQLASEGLFFPPTVSESAKTLIKRLLSKQPTARPTAAQVLQDPWMDQRPEGSAPRLPWFSEQETVTVEADDQLVPGSSTSSSTRKVYRNQNSHIKSARSSTAPYQKSRPLISPVSASSASSQMFVNQQPQPQPQHQMYRSGKSPVQTQAHLSRTTPLSCTSSSPITA